MHKPTTGRLLKRVAYALRKPEQAKNITGDSITVRDAFPYNPESKTAPKSALRWAGGYRYGNEPEYVPDVIERDNDPFTATITDLEGRGNGGRAYKVVDSDMRRFDLREDQLMEILRDVGILPGGVVAGAFVWGLAESQLRLVMVGGKLHKAMTEGAQAKDDLDAKAAAGELFEANRLVAGHVYKKRDGTLHAYLGCGTFPGTDKPQHAFVEMPGRPRPCDAAGDLSWMTPERAATYRTERAADAEVFRTWPTLEWAQRCRHAWTYNSYDSSTRTTKPTYHPQPIVLMAGPKFDSDEGEIEPAFLAALRANKGGAHRYVKSSKHGDDAVSKWKLQQLGVQPVTGRWARYQQTPSFDYEHAKKEFVALVSWRQEKET